MSDKGVDPFPVADPANALVREVFARFGRAVFAANRLERAIANVLLYLDWRARLQPPMTKEQYEQSYDAYVDGLHLLTMGALTRRLNRLPEWPVEIGTFLDQCVKARNVFAHHYFWERSGHFAIEEGQRQMLAECDEYTALFERAEEQVDAFLQPYHQGFGLTGETLVSLTNNVIRDAQLSMNLARTRET